MKKIQVLNTKNRFKERKDLLIDILKNLYEERSFKLKILEAGCGQRWGLASDEYPYILTGVDISGDALRLRQEREGDLDEVYVGDLRSISFPNASFDVIYSNFVLEHIRGAEQVLSNFHDWLKPGGLMIIQVPDNESTAVFVTKNIPHYFHILYYRHVKKHKNAGMPGHGPFKAYYDKILSIKGFRSFAEKNSCSIVLERGIMSPYKGFYLFSLIIHYLSFKRLSHKHNGLLYVIKKGQ